MRHRLAAALRRLGRACFRAADRVQPDAIMDVFDLIYPPPADEARAWSDREIADEIREIRGTLKPWTPQKLTAFQRKSKARR
jgi:hypothetical protein